jgi:DNA-binding beta-propeller fold protein YncE
MLAIRHAKMMADARWPGNGIVAVTAVGALALAILGGGARAVAEPQDRPAAPTSTYWAYVGAESADTLHRIRFGPDGTIVEKTIRIGELPNEMEGPHGLAISADGRHLYMTTGHGLPDGKLWKYELPSDTLVGEGLSLGRFPASLDLTSDGLYSFSVNFNLHGDMVPSTVSVVYTPEQIEVARIVTCTMPHGSRIDPGGTRQYSTCMMDDELVEIDTIAFEVSRRFSVAQGKEGPLAAAAVDPHDGHVMPGAQPATAAPVVDPAEVGYGGARHEMTPASCSPTWAQPSADGRRIFVACNKADEILEIDREAWTLVRRLPTGRGVYNLAVTPDGRLLVATLKQGHMFEVFDLANGRSLARLETSTTLAHGVAVSPDSRYAFVSSEGKGAEPGKVDVFDLRALARAGTVDVGQQASGIAFWKMQ